MNFLAYRFPAEFVSCFAVYRTCAIPGWVRTVFSNLDRSVAWRGVAWRTACPVSTWWVERYVRYEGIGPVEGEGVVAWRGEGVLPRVVGQQGPPRFPLAPRKLSVIVKKCHSLLPTQQQWNLSVKGRKSWFTFWSFGLKSSNCWDFPTKFPETLEMSVKILHIPSKKNCFEKKS